MNSLTPLVSIIIPVYNREEFIQEAVDSALTQTWDEKEIIVVDDGSTDNTSQLLQSFGNKIRTIRQNNQGLSAARNTGIEAAKGDYLAFLDSDDLLNPNCLELQIRNLILKPDIGISYCWWRYIDKNGQYLPEIGNYCERGNLLSQLIMTNRFPPLSAVIRRHLIDQIGNFDGFLSPTEDWDLWLRAALNDFKFDYVPDYLVKYRIHGGNLSLNTMAMHESQMRTLDKLFRDPGFPDQLIRYKPLAYARVYLTSTTWFFRADQIDKAREYFKKGVENWPELICQEETYYSLICSNQPPGYRATRHFKDLDLAQQRITDLFGVIFNDPALAPQIMHLKRNAQAAAKVSLANHYYMEGEDRRARELITLAGLQSFQAITNRHAASLWLRSLLGRERVQRLKRSTPGTEN